METCNVAVTAVGDLRWCETPSTGRKTGSRQPAPPGGSIHGTFRFPENDPHFKRGAIRDEIVTPVTRQPRELLSEAVSTPLSSFAKKINK